MQSLAWHWLRKENNSAISVLEVFRVLTSEGVTFIVMQLLDAELLNACHQYPMDQCYDLIAEGIQLLRRMPVPDDATPGPYSKELNLRRIYHPIFKDKEATVVYRSVDELQAHLNRVGVPRPLGSCKPRCHGSYLY